MRVHLVVLLYPGRGGVPDKISKFVYAKTSSTHLNVHYFNARSTVNKLSRLQNFAYLSSVNILAVSETWLTKLIFDNEILPTNYTIFRNDQGSRGGVVLLAVKDHIATKLLSSPTNLEMLTVEIKLSYTTVILCVVYPTLIEVQLLQDHLSQLPPSSNILLLGDFNLLDINWDILSSESNTSDAFCAMVFDLNLSELITCPTHIHGNILDLLLTTIDDLISNITVQSSEFSHFPSDHFLISFTLIMNSYPVSPMSSSTAHHVFDFSKADFLSMEAYISNSSIANCLTLDDVNAVWAIIKSVISDAMTQFIPKFQFHSKQYPVWFTKQL